jgi:hypothetical protein
MPIHDWTRVDAGLFHAFHQRWVAAIADALNAGVLPEDHYALPEQSVGRMIPDVLTLHVDGVSGNGGSAAAVAVAEAPVKARMVRKLDRDTYVSKANRIAVRHRHGEVVAVIEVVSPGNKASQVEFRKFVGKAQDLIERGIHLLIVDLLPPGRRDPQGIHPEIWSDPDYEPEPGKPLAALAYDSGEMVAYVEPLAVGDRLPEMPVFLQPGHYVTVPLEATYQTSWEVFPKALKGLLE